MNEKLKQELKKELEKAPNKLEFLNELKTFIHDLSPQKENPVDNVIWVPMDMVIANNYNPNHVAAKEMNLLYVSVKEDGYTQPIVTIWDESIQKYVIIDGFHRHLVIRKYADINERCHGMLPIVVLEKDINQRMASTVRHNRARGSHTVDGMVNILFTMLRDGKSEREICNALGMEQKEFVKLMHITGFSKIFKNYKYSQSIEKVVTISELENKKDGN
jgi:hypothetical protein